MSKSTRGSAGVPSKAGNGPSQDARSGSGAKDGNGASKSKRSRRAAKPRSIRPGWRRSGQRVWGSDSHSDTRADRVIEFIERLRVPSGFGQGKPFKLRDWQRDFIYAIYANRDSTGNRKTRRAILSIARKNGKTALIAALVLVHLIGPEAISNAEIVSAANDKEQAAQVYKYVKQIINLSPTLRDLLQLVDSKKRVVYHAADSFYAAISADANRKHGLNPVVVIYDELAQSKNRDLFDALDTAQGAQPEPLFITISTQSNDPQHPLSEMIDDGLNSGDESIVVHLYEVPDEIEDVFDEENWYSANPALGDFRSLKDMRAFARRAQRLPSLENTFRNLFLNQRVSLMSTLFSRSVWMARADKDLQFEPGEEVILALDMAAKIDLAALAMTDIEGSKLTCFFWKPEEHLEEHGRRDRQNYRSFYDNGFLERCPGKVINPGFVANKIAEIYGTYRIRGLAYDRWRIDSLLRELDEVGLDAGEGDEFSLSVVGWGQGFKDMSPAVDAFEEHVVNEEMLHSNHPLLNWNIANAVVTSDPAGNRKLDKDKARMRIDGAVAATMAMGLVDRLREDSNVSMYATEKLVSL